MTPSKDVHIDPKWSYLFDVQELEKSPVKLTISPGKDENKRLEMRMGLRALESLSADLVLERTRGGLVIHVTGRIKAGVKQSCVVSAEPVEDTIEEDFEAWFADPEAAVPLAKAKRDLSAKKGYVERPIMDEKEDPEAIIDGHIDLGELVTQYLSLAINPYPHAEGAEYAYGDDQKKDAGAGDFKNPFAALKDWKDKQREDES